MGFFSYLQETQRYLRNSKRWLEIIKTLKCQWTHTCKDFIKIVIITKCNEKSLKKIDSFISELLLLKKNHCFFSKY